MSSFSYLKSFLITAAVHVCTATGFCQQSAQNSFSPEQYVPKITWQNGVNCFAYASAYVALSTQYARPHHLKPDSSNAFSLGFVDGAIEALGEKNVKQAAWQLWGGDLGAQGNLDDSFYILVKYGTVTFKRFLYVDKKTIRHHFKETLAVNSDIKVLSRTELATPENYRSYDTTFNRIRRNIQHIFL